MFNLKFTCKINSSPIIHYGSIQFCVDEKKKIKKYNLLESVLRGKDNFKKIWSTISFCFEDTSPPI